VIIDHPVIHFNDRPPGAKIDAIVLHDTGGRNANGTLTRWRNPKSKTSAHYLIDRDGDIYRCVLEVKRAWHAGVSSLWNREDVNAYSIGIELVDDNDGDNYPVAQINAAVDLVAELCREYTIPINRVVGHCHVALPLGRKVDPGPDFNWTTFLLAVAHRVY